MALVMGITLPPGWEIIYNKTLKMYDISVLCNVGKNPRFFSRKKFYTLKEITYLFNIAYLWSSLSESDRNAWKEAGEQIGQHGYNLFVQDQSYRIKNAISGIATPSNFHQFTVGHIKIEAPATNAHIAQYNSRKIDLNGNFGMNYKTKLVESGPDPYIEFVLTWYNYYSGQTFQRKIYTDMWLSKEWTNTEGSFIFYPGRVGKWQLDIEINDLQGDFWFDNPSVFYSGQEWINDPTCLDVVKWWKGVNLPAGVTFETIYPTGDAL